TPDKGGKEFRVNTTAKGNQHRPRLAMAPDGRFVVAWYGDGKDGAGVYARRFTASGEPEGEEFPVSATPTPEAQVGSVSENDKGEFLVTYTLGAEQRGNFNTYLQRFDSRGGKLGEVRKVNTKTFVWYGESRGAIAPDGRFAVAFAPKDPNAESQDVLVSCFG